MDCRDDLIKIYELLNGCFGDLHWWPAEEPFEIMVGAILTQNTAWTNVEKAIAALKEKFLLSPDALSRIDEATLAAIIRPSGYYNVKAKRLKSFVGFFLEEYAGDIGIMTAEALPVLREKLLGVRGVGPETADSILLYACGKSVFVCDAYTRRILQRHGLIDNDADYRRIQAMFMNHLPHDAALFNQFHALIVYAGKTFCRKVPKCDACPLRTLHPERAALARCE
ncbi:MAG: endonuclease III domain-containing protein [Proteobacteria bacterium]|nr:endonuclease III domain-containing protein [Pseudomonadota bacterium]